MTVIRQSEIDVDELYDFVTDPDEESFENEYEVTVPLGNDTDEEVKFQVTAENPWHAIERIKDGCGKVVYIDRDVLDWRRVDVEQF